MVRIIGPSPAQSSSPTPRRPRPPRPRRRPPTMASAAASSSKPPVVLGCGAVSADYLATVASFPNPDDKIRSLTLKVQGGGNTGNALTAAARLGLRPRIISKVSNDPQGRNILKELQDDGVDTSHILVLITLTYYAFSSFLPVIIIMDAASIFRLQRRGIHLSPI
jgi:hypothetical protein